MKFIYILLLFLSSCSTTYYSVLNKQMPKMRLMEFKGATCKDKVEFYEYEINSYNKSKNKIDLLLKSLFENKIE